MPNTLNLEEAAKFLGIRTNFLRSLCEQCKIPAFKNGKEWRLRKSRLVEYLEYQKEKRLQQAFESLF